MRYASPCQRCVVDNSFMLIESVSRWRTFVFTMVRHPVDRATSHFYHFRVSRQSVNASDSNLIAFFKEREGYMFRSGWEKGDVFSPFSRAS